MKYYIINIYLIYVQNMAIVLTMTFFYYYYHYIYTRKLNL